MSIFILGMICLTTSLRVLLGVPSDIFIGFCCTLFCCGYIISWLMIRVMGMDHDYIPLFYTDVILYTRLRWPPTNISICQTHLIKLWAVYLMGRQHTAQIYIYYICTWYILYTYTCYSGLLHWHRDNISALIYIRPYTKLGIVQSYMNT